jgi:asparagine synthase (glutamine-hydrolysing)
MCGIAGFFKSEVLDRNDLVRMTNAVKHRGPDGEGFYFDWRSGTGLGHRRLSIFDLSPSGTQPMTYEDSGLWIVFNGEIYNFIELRKELEKKDYRFYSNTDTEVVLAAYREWGLDALNKFNGMWAFALYNEPLREMVLCRDRYGIKPLYFYDNDQLVFGSEYKVFWAVRKKMGIEWDLRGLKTALVSPERLASSGFTLLDHIKTLLPGRYLIANDRGVEVRQWWKTLDNLVSVPKTLEEQSENLRELLMDSCRLRMRSDVPIGSTLSGGIDSGSVVAIINHLAKTETGGERIAHNCHRCFTHVFPKTPQDETEFADLIVQKTGARGIHVEADKDDLLKNCDRILYDFESIYPGMPDSWWRIYRAMREGGVVVSLDGHGADELFGGYLWHIPSARKDSSIFSSDFWALFGLSRIMHVSGYLSSSLVQTIRGKKADTAFLSDLGSAIEPYQNITTELPGEWSALNNSLYQDFHHSDLPRILMDFDVMSMAHGVEVRMPFMDYRVVNYAFSLPSQSKIGGGYTKLVLRKAMNGLLPEIVLSRRRKFAFNSPLQEWFKIMAPWIESTLDMQTTASELISLKKLREYYDKRIFRDKFDRRSARIFMKYIHAIRLSGIMGKD